METSNEILYEIKKEKKKKKRGQSEDMSKAG